MVPPSLHVHHRHHAESSRRPVAPSRSVWRQHPYPRCYEDAYRDVDDDREDQHPYRRGGQPMFHPERRALWEPEHAVVRFQRSASDLEFESSPVATPLRLPTIDALCGGSAKKRRHSVTLDEAPSPFSHATPSPMNNSPSLTKPNSPGTSPVERRPRSRGSSMDDGDDEPSALATNAGVASTQPTKKRQRYLRDVDRRSIILRIEKGEKQAALAREFGVTRAAICHIKKNRDEIVSRYESLLESAKEMERAGMATPRLDESTTPATVQELMRPSVLLLLTSLRDVATSRRAFRAAADRLMTILLEEALASVATVACDLRTTTGQTVRGLRPGRRPCCVSVGHKGMPLLRLYQQIEPTAAVGCVQVVMESRDGEVVPAVGRVALPRELASNATDACVVLLTCSTSTGQSVCAAIDALLRLGVAETNVRVAALASTASAVDAIATQFPGVRVLTCAIEAHSDEQLAPSTTLSDFVERYSAGKVEPTDAVGTHPESWRNEPDERRALAFRGARSAISGAF